MKHIARFFTGILGLGIALLIIYLFDNNLATWICIAIFCGVILSGGMALILFLPAFYLIGWVILALVPQQKQSSDGVPKPDKEVLALISYIKKFENPLEDRDEIEEGLLGAGWDEKTIKTAYEFIRN